MDETPHQAIGTPAARAASSTLQYPGAQICLTRWILRVVWTRDFGNLVKPDEPTVFEF